MERIYLKLLLVKLLCILAICNNVSLAQPRILINSEGGKIENETGIIKIKTVGNLLNLQDTIGGTVIFLAPEGGRSQVVPNITYNKLILNANAWLYIDSLEVIHASSRPMSVLDSFIILSGERTKIYNSTIETHTKGNIYNNGRIKGEKDIRVNNQFIPQTINGADGKGSFSRLNIDNPYGVEIVSEFEVMNKLELTQGILKNTTDANVKLGNRNISRNIDTTDKYFNRPLIVRHTTGSIAAEPILDEPQISIHYVGKGSIFTGAEVPSNVLAIHTVRAENTDSLILSKNVNVTDSLFVGTHIHANDKDTLTLFSVINPEFHPNNPDAEVHGNFRRTNWYENDTIVFNNPMTYLLFKHPIDRTAINKITSTIYAGKFNPQPEGNTRKVKRSITVRAANAMGNEYQNKINAEYGYGWRHQGEKDETMDLTFDKLVLMYYDNNVNNNNKWTKNLTSATPPKYNSSGCWGYSHATLINDFGDFAIGLSLDPYLAFRGKSILEGAYRYDKGRMANDLQEKNYLPMPPEDIYPYNRDPNRLSYIRLDDQSNKVFPDSVVDWIVVEFRKEYVHEGSVKTLLLKTDGTIVDMWGNEQVYLTHTGEILGGVEQYPVFPSVDTVKDASFYVAILHRNHASIFSEMPINFNVGIDVFIDFTLPQAVLGRNSALKPVDRDKSNPKQFIYGMIAGDWGRNGGIPDGKIDEDDYNFIIPIFGTWTNRLLDGYHLNDINLNGTITTLDFNMVYNNRGRFSFYPY